MARITIEDSLKEVPSRFSLVHIVAERARQIIRGSRPLVETDNRAVVQALREVAAGKVTVAKEEGKSKKK